jgi:hypothetical protein
VECYVYNPVTLGESEDEDIPSPKHLFELEVQGSKSQKISVSRDNVDMGRHF